MGWKSLTAIGLVAYVIVLTATAPAGLVYPRLAPRLAPLELQGVAGTLWRGEARHARLADRALGALSWQMHPASLLRGRGEARLRLTADQSQLTARAGYGFFSGPYARRIQARIAPQYLAEVAGVTQLPTLSGRMIADLDRLVLQDQWITAATGMLRWEQAGVHLSEHVPLGDFAAQVTTTDDGIRAVIQDRDARLGMEGEALLRPDRRYELDLRVTPRAGLPRGLVQGLQVIGQRLPGGGYRIQREGRL